jgi:hypothetical protein
MANYPQELAQDTVCQSHTCHMTGLWFLPTRLLRLNTNEWIEYEFRDMKVADICFVSHAGFCIHQKLFHSGEQALKTHWRIFFFFKADDVYLVDYETDIQRRDTWPAPVRCYQAWMLVWQPNDVHHTRSPLISFPLLFSSLWFVCWQCENMFIWLWSINPLNAQLNPICHLLA